MLVVTGMFSTAGNVSDNVAQAAPGQLCCLGSMKGSQEDRIYRLIRLTLIEGMPSIAGKRAKRQRLRAYYTASSGVVLPSDCTLPGKQAGRKRKNSHGPAPSDNAP